MKAVLLISHGSQSPKTKQEVQALVKKLEEKSGIPIFEYAFLEIESPNIPEGIDRCVKKAASEIVVLLNFLNSGRHVDMDIPNIIDAARKKYPKIPIRISRPVGQAEGIADLFLKMIS